MPVERAVCPLVLQAEGLSPLSCCPSVPAHAPVLSQTCVGTGLGLSFLPSAEDRVGKKTTKMPVSSEKPGKISNTVAQPPAGHGVRNADEAALPCDKEGLSAGKAEALSSLTQQAPIEHPLCADSLQSTEDASRNQTAKAWRSPSSQGVDDKPSGS